MKYLENYTPYDSYLLPVDMNDLQEMIDVVISWSPHDFKLIKSNHQIQLSQDPDYFILHTGMGSYYNIRSYNVKKSEVEKFGKIIKDIDLELSTIKYNL